MTTLLFKLKKHSLLYKYIKSLTLENKTTQDNIRKEHMHLLSPEDKEYLNSLLDGKIYINPPFNINKNTLIELCNTKNYNSWLEKENVIIKYPLNVLLSLGTADIEYIELKYNNNKNNK